MNFHNELNPKIWNKDNTIKDEVYDKLVEITEAFIDYLNIPEDSILDVRLVGSSANYNYTPHSDMDIHVVVDYDKVHEDCPIVEGYLWSLKSQFNKEHDISIYKIPVEMYAEDSRTGAVSNGTYSIMNDEWIKRPEKIEPTTNDSAVEAKYEELKEAVDRCDDSEEAQELQAKIYQMRKAGLSKEGEFSTENLVFKKLRDDGCLDKLKKLKKEQIDKQLTLESLQKYITYKDDKNGSPIGKKMLTIDQIAQLVYDLPEEQLKDGYEYDTISGYVNPQYIYASIPFVDGLEDKINLLRKQNNLRIIKFNLDEKLEKATLRVSSNPYSSKFDTIITFNPAAAELDGLLNKYKALRVLLAKEPNKAWQLVGMPAAAADHGALAIWLREQAYEIKNHSFSHIVTLEDKNYLTLDSKYNTKTMEDDLYNELKEYSQSELNELQEVIDIVPSNIDTNAMQSAINKFKKSEVEENMKKLIIENEEFLTPKEMIPYKQYVPENDNIIYTFVTIKDDKAYFRKGRDGFDKSVEFTLFNLDDKFTRPGSSSRRNGIDPLPNYMLMGNGAQRNNARIDYIKQHGKPSQYESVQELNKAIKKVLNEDFNAELFLNKVAQELNKDPQLDAFVTDNEMYVNKESKKNTLCFMIHNDMLSVCKLNSRNDEIGRKNLDIELYDEENAINKILKIVSKF